MSKLPFVTKEQIEEIVKTYPTPFHIYDERGLTQMRRQCRRHLPGIRGLRSILR